MLEQVLIALLTDLRPRHQDGAPPGSPWRFYNCRYYPYPYVRGISRRRALTVLRGLLERRTCKGWQRRGSDTIAAALREKERAAEGEVPPDPAQRGVPHVGKTPHDLAHDGLASLAPKALSPFAALYPREC